MKLARDLSGQRGCKGAKKTGLSGRTSRGFAPAPLARRSPGNDPTAFGPLAKNLAKRLETGRNNNRRTYARPLVQLNRNTSLDTSIFASPLRSEP